MLCIWLYHLFQHRVGFNYEIVAHFELQEVSLHFPVMLAQAHISMYGKVSEQEIVGQRKCIINTWTRLAFYKVWHWVYCNYLQTFGLPVAAKGTKLPTGKHNEDWLRISSAQWFMLELGVSANAVLQSLDRTMRKHVARMMRTLLP